jgi:hypothetical protein
MGRRSRQREPAPAAGPPSPPRPPGAPRRRARLDEAPRAPWHPVPLVEIAVLVGLIALAVGFFSEGRRQQVLVTSGVLLASAAGLEISLREHFSGYRSHTALLALAAALGVGVPVGVLLGERLIGIAVAVVAGAAAAVGLRRAFARRAGGLTWRA